MASVRCLLWCLVYTLTISDAFCQQTTPFDQLFKGLLTVGAQQQATEAWQGIAPLYRQCVNVVGSRRGLSIDALSSRGISPEDPRALVLVSKCAAVIDKELRLNQECTIGQSPNPSFISFCDESYAERRGSQNVKKDISEVFYDLAIGREPVVALFERTDAQSRREQMQALGLTSGHIPSPGFRCEKSRLKFEYAICASYELSRADAIYSSYFATARGIDRSKTVLQKARAVHRQVQMCADDYCIKQSVVSGIDFIADFLTANGQPTAHYKSADIPPRLTAQNNLPVSETRPGYEDAQAKLAAMSLTLQRERDEALRRDKANNIRIAQLEQQARPSRLDTNNGAADTAAAISARDGKASNAPAAKVALPTIESLKLLRRAAESFLDFGETATFLIILAAAILVFIVIYLCRPEKDIYRRFEPIALPPASISRPGAVSNGLDRHASFALSRSEPFYNLESNRYEHGAPSEHQSDVNPPRTGLRARIIILSRSKFHWFLGNMQTALSNAKTAGSAAWKNAKNTEASLPIYTMPIVLIGFFAFSICFLLEKNPQSIVSAPAIKHRVPALSLASSRNETNSDANATSVANSGLSGVYCAQGKSILEVQTFSFRNQSIPIDSALDAFINEDNFEYQQFMMNSVRYLYESPTNMRERLNDGTWMRKCVEAVRGY